MNSPYFRSNQDLGRCRSGQVLMIHWIHKLAGLATKKGPELSPSTREVLAAAIVHTRIRLFDEYAWLRKWANSVYRKLGARIGQQ